MDRRVQSEMKTTLRVGGASVLNIYSVGFGASTFRSAHLLGGNTDASEGTTRELLGYSTYPWLYENNTVDDGVVILYASLPGGSKTHFNEGKTLSHEIGHWLGLYHPFQGGCDGDGAAYMASWHLLTTCVIGDYVDDTPPQVKTTYGCPEYQDSCPGNGVDNIHNYMDYGYDSCMYVGPMPFQPHV